MKHTRSFSLLLLSACIAVLWGSEAFALGEPPTGDQAMLGVKKNEVKVPEQKSPKVQLGELTGVITVYDDISQRISIQDAKGAVVVFRVDAVTPVLDHNVQIGFGGLRKGDRVSVHYDTETRSVNAIEKI